MAKQTRVGLLVLAALVTLVATVLSLDEQRHFWERKVPYEVHFARSNGLQEGAPVGLSGVSIGTVAAITFPEDVAARYLQVTIHVKGAAASRIRRNTLASIRTIGLLGDRYIELTPGTNDADALEAGGIIPSIDPTDYEALFGQSGDVVTNFAEVTAQVKDVLGHVQRGEGLLGGLIHNREVGEGTLEDLRQSMAHLEASTESLVTIVQRVERGEGLLGQLVRETPDSRRLMANLNEAARSVNAMANGRGAVPRLFEDKAYAERVLGSLDRTIANLEQITAKLARGEGSLGKLVHDDTLYNDASNVFARLRGNLLLRLFGGSEPKKP